MKKVVLWGVGIVFLGLLGWRISALISDAGQGQRSGQGGQQVAVKVIEAAAGQIQEVRDFTGTVYPQYQYDVSPKISGRLVAITKRIGDWVEGGEQVALLDDAEYEQAVLEAEANLKIAEASLDEAVSQTDLAAQELDRVRSLQAKGIASPSELDIAGAEHDAQKSRLALAEAQVQQREAALNSARIRLGYTALAAVEPGFVGERYVDEGALLSVNAPLISVVGIDRVIVQATIIERDYGQIVVGQTAHITVDAYPGEIFEGTVARIAPVLQEASRVAKMEVEVDNPSHLLKPGMFAEVTVVLEQKEARQVIPVGAVIRKDGADGIFVVESDGASDGPVARFYPIDTGIVTDSQMEILSPEITGPVVILGQYLLEDGGGVVVSAEEGEGAS